MRRWIWIAIVATACSSGKTENTDKVVQPVEVRQPTVTSNVIDGVRVLRIDRADGPTLFVRADAVAVCGEGCRRLLGTECPGPDCIPTQCPCDKEECSKWCKPPHQWPKTHDLLGILKNHGVVDPNPIDPPAPPPAGSN
jgi:hypothetical protein